MEDDTELFIPDHIAIFCNLNPEALFLLSIFFHLNTRLSNSTQRK